MSVKPDTPITRKEMYLDVMTGGSSTLPEPEIIEEKYLAKIAGMAVDLPAPVPLKHKFLAKIAGMQVDVPTYTTGLPRIYAYLAKAAGQEVEVPQPITREEMYWFDYVSTPSEKEYTGAVPVTFTANGQPLLDYLISGNTVQNGTPTPSSPIMPEGTGERTRNLFDYTTVTTGYRIVWSTGALYVDSTGAISDYIKVNIGAKYRYYSSIPDSTAFFIGYNQNKEYLGVYNSALGFVKASSNRYNGITIPSDSDCAYIKLMTFASDPFDNTSMLAKSSTALQYEPYGYKIPISSANTTTPIYLGEVPTTRRIRKLVLTGDETITSGSVIGQMRTSLTGAIDSLGYCTHYILKTVYGGDFPYIRIRNNTLWIEISPDGYETKEEAVADFKAYLAQQYANGTPVTIWYVLATEKTAIVNEPLMKIGDYADTLSMEQAGMQIPTVNGSDTLDVLTAVKPSEVYIKYKGEPVPQLSMLSSPGTDDPEEPSEEAEEIPEEETSEEVPEEVQEETESITPETAEE